MMTEGSKDIKSAHDGPGAWSLLFVLLIGVLFLYYNFRNLENFSFSSGELAYVNAAAEGSFPSAFEYILKEENPNVFHTAAFMAASKIFGNISHVSMRAPSLLFAALSIFIFFGISKMFFPGGMSVVSTVIFAMSPALASSALDAGPYSLFLFAVLLLIRLVMRLPDKEDFPGKLALLFSLLVCFDTSFYTVLILPACFFVLHTACGLVNEHNKKSANRPAAMMIGLAVYSAAAAALVYIFYYGYGVSCAPPSTAWGADISFSEWIKILFAGAAGGMTASNASLAFIVLALSVYGTYHALKARRRTYAVPLFFLLSVSILAALYFTTKINPVYISEFTRHIAFISTILIPFVSMMTGAAAYYFYRTILRRDALSIYTVGILVRVAITGMFMFFLLCGFSYFTIKGLKDTATLERENWPAVSRYLAQWTSDGDTILYHWQDARAVDYFIKPRLKNTEPGVRETSGPSTWIIRMSPGKGFDLPMDILDEISRDEGARTNEGPMGNISTTYLGGTLVAGRAIVHAGPEKSIKSLFGNAIYPVSRSNVYCNDGSATCSFKLYFPEPDIYSFSVRPSSYQPLFAAPENISLCDDSPAVFYRRSGSEAFFADRKLERGYCEIRILPGKSGPGLYIFNVHKRAPSNFDLYYSIRISKNER